MPKAVLMFAVATLLPLPLLVGGALAGGGWIIAAVLYLTVFTVALDQLISGATAAASATGGPAGQEFPAAQSLSVVLAAVHFPLLLIGVLSLAGFGSLALWERGLVFLAFGLFFGQVSNSNAHELIHRSTHGLHRLGSWVYISILFGHHASAHPRVHHRLVAGPGDPNSAALGESYYRFARRAWTGSFAKGYREETRLWQAGTAPWWQHPYVAYIGGGLGFCLGFWLIAGLGGLFAYGALAGHATAQLLLSDYVQHYGLRRQKLANGRLEPVGPGHSWNAPHWFSNYLMLAAPRHSDHHLHPTRPYPALELAPPDQVPTLPYSLPMMGFVALNPRRWRALMDPLVVQWAGVTTRPEATPGETQLIEAIRRASTGETR